MAVPTVLPAEAIALDSSISKKRRHSQAIDLTKDDATTEPHPEPTTNEAILLEETDDADERRLEDSDDEDRQSAFEDVLDQIEAAPYINDGTVPGMTNDNAAELRAMLKDVGVEEFFKRTIEAGLEPRDLGIAFGITPTLDIDDDTYMRLLTLAIVRSFYKRQKLSQYNTIDDAARLLQSSEKIMVITGAGISTSLGIPDFRSEGSGFYDQVRDMNLPGITEPSDVFDIDIFDEDPAIFFSLAGSILPAPSIGFSPTHGFIRHLQDLDKLQTNYTQNIDNLEERAGIDDAKVIQCHGSFKTATCRKCGYKVKGTEVESDVLNKRVPKCERCVEERSKPQALSMRPTKRSKSRHNSDDEDEDDDIPQPGVMKPDITFFGQQLPEDFFKRFTEQDAKETDLVLVIGTSLKVAPVSEMPNHIPHHVPHIYISLEPIRHVEFDIQLLGNCDDVVVELCKRAGWKFEHPMARQDAEMVVSSYQHEGKAGNSIQGSSTKGPQSHMWTVRTRSEEVAACDKAADGADVAHEDDKGAEPHSSSRASTLVAQENQFSITPSINGGGE